MSASMPTIGPVQSGIPVAARQGIRRTNTVMGVIRAALSELKPGDCRDLGYPEGKDVSGFSRLVHRGAQMEKIVVTTRKTEHSTMRVWRIK